MTGLFSFLFPPSISAHDAAEALRGRDVVALDVRERGEWTTGRISGSKNLPLGTLAARTGELSRDRRYVAVCATGARSGRATAQLRRQGFEVVNLKGGLRAWSRAGLPLDPRNRRAR